MTNAEKFEEVFGYKLADPMLHPCDFFDDNYCEGSASCPDCPLNHFWEREYVYGKEQANGSSKA